MTSKKTNQTEANILVVDDTPENLHLLINILKKEGYLVRPAINGERALVSAEAEPPDLILLDIKMPDMTGYEVCEKLKANNKTSDIPVIFISALTDVNEKVKGFSVGAVDYIMKPFQTEEVLARVKTHLTITQLQKALQYKNKQLQEEIIIRERVEESLVDLNNNLDQKVQEQTEELKNANKHLQRELDIQTALAEVSSGLIAESYDIKKIIQSIMTCAQKLTDSAHAYVSFVNPKRTKEFSYIFTEMAQSQKNSKSIIDRPDSDGKYRALMDYASRIKKPFYINDPEDHPASMGLSDGYIPVKRFLFVPVMIENQIYAQITTANSSKNYDDNDIAAIKRLAELYALALHRQIFESEKESLQKQILQMQKLEAIGTLAGGIAHDFNNLLFIMTGLLEMILRKMSDTNPFKDNLESVFSAANRSKKLIKQILTFARKTEEQEKQPILVELIVKEIISLVRSTLPATIQIISRINKNCGQVLADPTHIHQIVMNLVTNAFHAMEKTGGKLKIKLEKINLKPYEAEENKIKPGIYIRLVVSDTGVGMTKGIIDKIFDPYFTTKKKGKGTGLGLSVVHGIVKSCNGIIKVDSEITIGTTFEVLLPEYRPEKKETEMIFEEDIKGGNETILFVEDESETLKMVSAILEHLGYKVTAFDNPEKALDAFIPNPNQFDLVITDMTMPVMTGIQLSKYLITLNPELPIIIYTGFSDQIDGLTLKNIGIRGYLMKPISINELARAIRKALVNP